MSDYTKIQNWASLSGAPIQGDPFDTEYAAVATASATKANKKIPAANNNMASLSGTGDLQDSGVLTSNVADAVAYHYSTGDIKTTAVDSEPTGWLYADGGAHSTSTYAALFAAIGYTYGGSGATFQVPDLRGTVTVGLDNLGGSPAGNITDAAADGMGGTGGVESHALAESELPAHTHTGDTDTDGIHSHEIKFTFRNRDVSGTSTGIFEAGTSTFNTETDGAHTHAFTSDSTGGGTAHTNVQPYIALNFLIKT